MRAAKFFGSCAVAAFLVYLWLHADPSAPSARPTALPVAAASWAHRASLPDHFARHGSDFGARNADEYALFAAQFLERARRDGLPAKVDKYGVLRVYDPRSDTFGAYDRDGTAKTFFKPGSSGYFDRQPGRPIDLRRR